MKIISKPFLIILLGFFVTVSCKKEDDVVVYSEKSLEKLEGSEDGGPVKEEEGFGVAAELISISPRESFAGLKVEIKGSNFSTINSENKVFFNDISAQVVSSTTDLLTVIVPKNGVSGSVKVKVNEAKTSNPLSFSYYKFPAAKIENNCNTNKSPLQISDFKMDEITLSDNEEYYSFTNHFTVTNIGFKDLDVDELTLQSWISDDDKFGNDDTAAGGRVAFWKIISPNTPLEKNSHANSSIMENGFDIDGKYLILQVKYEHIDCIDLIIQELEIR